MLAPHSTVQYGQDAAQTSRDEWWLWPGGIHQISMILSRLIGMGHRIAHTCSRSTEHQVCGKSLLLCSSTLSPISARTLISTIPSLRTVCASPYLQPTISPLKEQNVPKHYLLAYFPLLWSLLVSLICAHIQGKQSLHHQCAPLDGCYTP